MLILSGIFWSVPLLHPFTNFKFLKLFQSNCMLMLLKLKRFIGTLQNTIGSNVTRRLHWIGCSGLVACKGLFRDSSAATIRCFAKNLGVTYAFQAEIVEVMMTIEIAHMKAWIYSGLRPIQRTLVTLVFKNPSIIPWFHQNRWCWPHKTDGVHYLTF
jgi:hypothetical protein